MRSSQFLMIADEHRFTRQLMKDSLEDRGYQVISFDEPDDALHFWLEHHPDLSIVNGSWSKNDGPFSPTEIVRKAEGRISHLLYLGNSTGVPTVPLPGTPIRFHYLIKPFIIRDLIKVVDSILKRHPAGFVPIFQGDLVEFSVWNLLKKIEEQGLTGEMNLVLPNGEKATVFFKAGMIDVIKYGDRKDDEAMNAILGLTEGEFVVYQKLMTFSEMEAQMNQGKKGKYDHFVIPESIEGKESLLWGLLEVISKSLFEIAGRNETIKILLHCIKKLRPQYPFLQLLNVDYSGEVSLFNWKKELDLETVQGFAELMHLFISEVNRQILNNDERTVKLEQLIERMDAKLEEVNFYQIYQELEIQKMEREANL
jgi:DNA-binding response OmpR family regulator